MATYRFCEAQLSDRTGWVRWKMLETSATNAIAAAVERSLGVSCEVSASTNDHPGRSGKAAVARCMGEHGRLCRVRFDGWGPAFERMRIAFELAIDLRWDTDTLIVSVLTQGALTFEHQNHRRVRAAALGIPNPLNAEAFTEPRRLRIDSAAATALRRVLGSDAAARSWIESQLRTVAERMGGAAGTSALQVQGLNVGIPFSLGPLKLLSVPQDWNRRVRWLDNEIRLSSFESTDAGRIYLAVTRILDDTPLEGRPIVEGAVWSCEKSRRANGAGGYDALVPSSTTSRGGRAWRFLLERRMVGLCEAFP